jgi:hypothetical protein
MYVSQTLEDPVIGDLTKKKKAKAMNECGRNSLGWSQ